VLAGGGAAMPFFTGGRWAPCAFGPVAAFRWVPDAERTDGAEHEASRNSLHRVFVVPDGEPIDALMAHISALSGGDRLWFEHGVVIGDTVMVSHEALSDTPAHLALPRLQRRFRCTAREAAGLAELFIALDAGRDVVAHYEAEARHRSVGTVIEDLVHLVARLALAEEVDARDALEHADRLGDWAEAVANDGHLAQHSGQSDGDGALLAWHALGSVQSERVVCPVCGAAYEADDEDADIPVCPGCGAADTWENRQGPAFRALIAEIDGCGSLGELGVIGKRLYALALAQDMAGVAWTHYRIRRAALGAAVALGAEARALIAQVERARERELPRVGAKLYRVQRIGVAAITRAEWRRIWAAYAARRRARAA
jgi:hypothetical protein